VTTPVRAASATAVVIVTVVALLLWLASAGNTVPPGDGEWALQLVAATAFLGLPLALAGAVVVHRLANVARGRDAAERLLRLATAGMHGDRSEWSTAMRAELASIGDLRERRRFAVGCAAAALRSGAGTVPWVVALGVGLTFAAGTFVASRASLAGSRSGILQYTAMAAALALFATTFVTGRLTRSFRTALVTAVLASFAGAVGMLTVEMIESVHWHHVAGVYLTDGDGPTRSTVDALLDPLAPQFLLLPLAVWLPWPLLGAAAGALPRRARAGNP
jgi:hypothetical protein